MGNALSCSSVESQNQLQKQLYEAVITGNLSAVKYCIPKGVHVSHPFARELTEIAAVNSIRYPLTSDDHLEIFRILLENGSPAPWAQGFFYHTFKQVQQDFRKSALSREKLQSILEILLAHNVDLDPNLLNDLVRHEIYISVEFLLQYPTKEVPCHDGIERKNAEKNLNFDIASKIAIYEKYKNLHLSKVEVDWKTLEENRVNFVKFMGAARAGKHDFVATYLGHKENLDFIRTFFHKSGSILYYPIQNGWNDMVKDLMIYGINPNFFKDKDGSTLLHIAAKKNAEIIPILLEVGVENIDCLDEKRNTPLMDAVECDNIQAIYALLNHPTQKIDLLRTFEKAVDQHSHGKGYCSIPRQFRLASWAEHLGKGEIAGILRYYEHQQSQALVDALNTKNKPLTWQAQKHSVLEEEKCSEIIESASNINASPDNAALNDDTERSYLTQNQR